MSASSMLVKQLECLPCTIEDVPQPFPTEAHHCNLGGLAGQVRRGDEFQIPLCGWHHRGLLKPRMSRDGMTELYGPSLVTDSRQFHFSYGSDDQMVANTNAKIARLLPVTA